MRGEMNCGDILTATARSHPDRVAWIWGDRRRTYRESDARADAVARHLASEGVGRGDRVALFLKNCPEFAEVLFGTMKLGAVIVPLNARFTAHELIHHLHDSGARALVVDAATAPMVASVADELSGVEFILQLGGEPVGRHRDFEQSIELHLSDEPFVSAEVVGDELAWLAYTSGTTGLPKGAMLTHRNLVFQAVTALADPMRLEHRDNVLHATPLTHASGYNALAYTMAGCGQVILGGAGFTPAAFFDAVAEHGVCALFLVPTMIKMIVDDPGLADADLSSLRWVMYGGAPMYVEDLRRAIDLIGPVFVQIFGQVETPMTGTVLPAEEHRLDDPLCVERLASCGRARRGVEVAIFDAEDRRVAPGEVGELCVRGASVMAGYWERPEETADTLRNGWLHTGDVGRVDEGGYVYLLDRNRDLVISGGMNVYPREIEEILLQHDAVAEVCVFGVPDPKWGEAVTAHVVLEEDATATAEELIAHVGSRAAAFKKPKTITFVDELPKTSYGKLDKKAVRAPYWAGESRLVR